MADELNWIEDLKDFNKELEERILAANEDAAKIKWSKLLPDLMTSEILMVGQFSGQKNDRGEKVMNILMMQKDGHVIVPFFTSPERIGVLANSEKNQFDVMKLNTVRFFQSIKGQPAVMNPLSKYARVFSPFEMNILVAENLDRVPPIPPAAEAELSSI